MKRCKTCKWWERGASLDNGEKCHICGYSDDFNRGKESEVFELEYSADDDCGLEGQIVTGPDFGCIHHKQGVYKL